MVHLRDVREKRSLKGLKQNGNAAEDSNRSKHREKETPNVRILFTASSQ